jgi:hypothetical protein
VFVGDESHEGGEVGRGFLDEGDVFGSLSEFGGAVDSSHAGLSGPFAVNV